MILYYLRNRLTGLYFDGTNFRAATLAEARPFLDEVDASLSWDNSTVERWEFPYGTALLLR